MKQGRKNALLATKHRHLFVEPLEDRRMLAVFLVTSLDDSGAGSLRDAIASANGNGIADTINFSVVGSINIASQLPTITEDLTIKGPGSASGGLTIDAGDGIDGDFNTGDGYRIFAIDDGNNVEQIAVNIGGLKLTGGDAGGFVNGGAIFNTENLRLSEVELIANASSSDGGGVYSYEGTLSFSSSTISGNTTGGDGGGVYVDYGKMAIIGSTVSGNTAGDRGGGVYIDTELSLTATIDNSTISSNTAIAGPGGGLCNRDGLTVILATTITGNTAAVGNGSGVASFGNNFTRTEIAGSIIADNTNEDVAVMIFNSVNSVQSNGFNLIGSGGGLLDGLFNFTASGDQRGVDPLLGPLADNGGPTRTHALLPGSPAIDAGDPSILFNPFDFDQSAR